MTLAPKLVQALRAGGDVTTQVICGGVIPAQDYNYLKQHGIRAIFGPGTNIPAAAREVVGLIRGALG
jgi:methylmalonyl-CoA mutase